MSVARVASIPKLQPLTIDYAKGDEELERGQELWHMFKNAIALDEQTSSRILTAISY
jgi:hypothetical protein